MKKKEQKRIELRQLDQIVVSTAEKKVVELKCKLANLVVQQQILCQNIVLAEKDLIEKIDSIATIHGIAPAEAKLWNFNIETMTFTLKQ